MVAFVINKDGEQLMPCSDRKARLLLKNKKAKIINYNPFAIQLRFASGHNKQSIEVGVDVGSKHLGLAITSEDKVLMKGEIEFRTDVSSLIETRKIYRKSRRTRKTRYREARFLNRKCKENWLPPSTENRIKHTFRWIDKISTYLPNPKLNIEVGKFDVQKMIEPAIKGVEYQRGQTYGYHDVRYFVFARDAYMCQVCKGKNKILNTHHIIFKSRSGTDRADNLITICTGCHTSANHKPGKILHNWMLKGKKTKSYKETAFMNIIRRRIFSKYPTARITYGSITTPHRKTLGLSKTHYNDAIAITNIQIIKKNTNTMFYIKQFRKKKRSLHEATARKGRKQKNAIQKRNSKNVKQSQGFFLNDQVKYKNQTGWISGFNGKTMAFIKNIRNEYVTNSSKSYKQVNLTECLFIKHQNNWQFSPHLTPYGI